MSRGKNAKRVKNYILAAVLGTATLFSACAGEAKDYDPSAISSPSIGAEIKDYSEGSGAFLSFSEIGEEDLKRAFDEVVSESISDVSESVADGIDLRTLSYKDIKGAECKVFIAEVKLESLTLSASTPFNAKPFGTYQSLKGQAGALSFAGENILFGVNAGFSSSGSNIPTGIIIKDGETLFDIGYDDGAVFFGVTEDNKAFICTRSEFLAIYSGKVSDMVSGLHLCVDNGAVNDTGERDENFNGKDSRCGAGISSDGKSVYFLTADSGYEGAAGISTADMAKLLISCGCVRVIDFEGGKSSSMIKKSGDDFETVNKVFGEGFGFAVPSAIFVTD